MDPSSSKTSTSMTSQEEEFDVSKHPDYIELVTRQNNDAKSIKLSNDLEGAQKRQSFEYNQQTDRENLIRSLLEDRRIQVEVRRMFDSLKFEDFEELRQKILKREQPNNREQQQQYSKTGQMQQAPTVNTINAQKQERVKIFKGKQRECDTHWIPGRTSPNPRHLAVGWLAD